MATKYTKKLTGQRVLVIGGTAGIGFGVAEGAVEFGAHVIVASSQQENVDNAVKKLQKTYPDASDRIQGHICDYKNADLEDTLKKVLDFATNNNTIKLDHVVDTAGGTPVNTTMGTVEPSQIHDMVNARLVPKILLSKLAKTYLKDTYTSSLTFTSGSLVYKPIQGYGLLAAMGGGDSLPRGLARELAPIRVNLVVPGAINTQLMERFAQGGDVNALKNRFASQTLLQRVGEVEDVAECYLSAMKNYFQTGTAIHAEGGYFLA